MLDEYNAEMAGSSVVPAMEPDITISVLSPTHAYQSRPADVPLCWFLVPQVPSVSKESSPVTSNHVEEDALYRVVVPVRTVQIDDACAPIHSLMHTPMMVA